MIAYLSGHFRYHTMNSWNRADSYAVRIKIQYLGGLDREVRKRCLGMLEVPEAFDGFRDILDRFGHLHDYRWQIGRNGRSGGYLVLYQGGRGPSPYKSFCRLCGQGNFRTASEENRTCGGCGAEARQNERRFEIFTRPGLGTDMDEDFEEWDTGSLRERVDLVDDFDRACEEAVASFVEFAKTHVVEDEEILVPRTIRVAKETGPA